MLFRLIFLTFTAAALGACGSTVESMTPIGTGSLSTPAMPSGATSAVGAPMPAAGNGPMTLQAGDKMRVTVYGEDQLSGEFVVDPSGYVSLPLAGTVQAAGFTKPELEKSLAQKFKSGYLRDPKVTVDVVAFRPIYVLGEVQKPGEYPYRSGLDVVSAIAVAGGSTYRASQSRVVIKRFGESAQREYQLDPSVSVMPGDTISIPERYF